MPYSDPQNLPKPVLDAVPSSAGRRQFMSVVNAQLEAGKSDAVAFASAWAALENSGYQKDERGKWVKKTSPTPGDVHVPSGDWKLKKRAINDDVFTLPQEAEARSFDLGFGGAIHVHEDRDGQRTYMPGATHDEYLGRDEDEIEIEISGAGGRSIRVEIGPSMVVKADTYQPPASAKNNAQKVLDWREEHGDDVNGMTDVGWARARQLASGKPVGLETVKAMAQFNRHRKNAEVAEEHRGTPWKDAGHVAWLGWGGTTGVDWAREISADKASNLPQDTVKAEGEEGTSLLKVLKADEEQRVVWGWASVISEDGEPVVDSQGDVISADELSKAANEFMTDVRVAKAMHEGEQIGEVLHSFPLTKELGAALGIESNREGWIIGMRVNDDVVWQRVKSGELSAFSVGGTGVREKIDA